MASLNAELERFLEAQGCWRIRTTGKHEIWRSPHSDRAFPVPHTVKSRHTANEIFKQAGLKKAF